MSTERTRIVSADELSLEAEVDEPAAARGALVLCHPHPQMGGTMNAPLLLALRDELVGRGWAVVRFNFRGIGSSEGEPSTGIEEIGDAAGAIMFARTRWPGVPVAVAGWSFGAAVAVRAAARDGGLEGCVAIAPSIEPRPGITAGLPGAAELGLGVRLLVVCAANDDLVDLDAARAWTKDVEGAELVVLAGANHFFWAQYDKLAATVAGWLDDLL